MQALQKIASPEIVRDRFHWKACIDHGTQQASMMHVSSTVGSPPQPPPPPPPPQLLIGGQAVFSGHVVSGHVVLLVQLSHHASNSSRCSSSVIENSSSSPSWFNSFSVMTTSSKRAHSKACGPASAELIILLCVVAQTEQLTRAEVFSFRVLLSDRNRFSMNNPSCPQDSVRSNQT